MSTLKELIAEEIAHDGPMTFARFMELCLYHPGHGYYTAGPRRAGEEWMTGPTLAPILGRTLARGIAPLLAQVDEPTLVEVGTGSGELVSDVAAGVLGLAPELADRLRVVAVDRSPAGRERAEDRLAELPLADGQVRTAEHVPQSFEGVLLSNELLDAFPVHLCRTIEDGITELHVDQGQEGFELVQGPVSASPVALWGRQRASGAEPGVTFEVPLPALTWYREIAADLQHGAIVTIDYGADGSRILDQLPEGTVHGYHQGRATTRILDHPGQQDLTSLVPFDLVAQTGEQAGLETRYYGTQGVTLEGLGIRQVATGGQQVLAAKKLVDPDGAGGTFQVLVQHRGLAELAPWPAQAQVVGPGTVHAPWRVDG